MFKNQVRVLSVIIGTMIGAGFASGKELYLFFGQYGPIGIIGTFLSCFLTSFIIDRTFLILYQNSISSYEDFLKYLLGGLAKYPLFFLVIKNIISLFLLVSFFIMVAGFGAYFAQELSLSPIIGSLFLVLLCLFIFSRDVSGIVKVNTLLIPLFILFVLFLGAENIPFLSTLPSWPIISSSGLWWLDAILYSSYNSILLIPILVTLTPYLTNKKQIHMIAFSAFGIFFLLSLILLGLLLRVSLPILQIEIPVLFAIKDFGNFQNLLYGIMILIAILTSAISAGYSFLQNFSFQHRRSYQILSFAICTISLFTSSIGFSELMELLYPIFGYLGIVQICLILLKKRHKTDIKRREKIEKLGVKLCR